jgi:hypothetical protein
MTGVNIAKTFTKSASALALSAGDRARVFDFLTKFLADPASPGLSVERLQRGQDPNI